MRVKKRRKDRLHYKLTGLYNRGFADVMWCHLYEPQSGHKMYLIGFRQAMNWVLRQYQE